MRILVTGGTGTIGNQLVSNLLFADHQLVIVTRNPSRVKNSWKDKVELVEANLSTIDPTLPNELSSILENIDGVINLIGENVFSKRWTKKQKDRIYESRVVSGKNLVAIINGLDSKPEVFVSVSGTDIYPPSNEDTVFVENEKGTNPSFLGRLSKDWEDPISELEGVRAVILRMGATFTFSGKAAEMMFLPHKLFVGGWMGSGKQIYSWIHIDDFTGLFQWAVENNNVSGIYNGVAPDYRTMKELAKIGGTVLKRWTWIWTPGFMLKIVLGKRAEMLLQGRAVSSKKVVEEGYKFKFTNAEDAIRDVLLNKP